MTALSTVDDVPGRSTQLVDFERIETGLIAEFCPPLTPDEIHRCLVTSVSKFHSGSVLNYLSILVEREAREQLRALVENTTT
jgi:hypothetical protein